MTAMSSRSASARAQGLRAGDAAVLLRALANEHRLMLLSELARGERSVADLEQSTGIGQPSLSQQLGVLRVQALVRTRREGRRIFYSIGDPRALELVRVLHGIFCERRGNAKPGRPRIERASP